MYFDDGDFSRADFTDCVFIDTKFNKTILTSANFEGATFLNCNLNRVNLSGTNFCVKEIRDTVIYGISSWDLKVSENSVQSNLVIEKTYDLYSEIIAQGRIPQTVDNIELAQFIYYLSNHKKMRDTINILNKRGVLLLGKFKEGGLNRMYKLKEWFNQNNYLSMIFDFDRPSSLDYTETIVTLSGLSKIVVADLSGDSVPHELHVILSNFSKPVIVYHDKAPYSMLKDLKRKNRYFHEIMYDGSEENLFELLPEKIAEAEADFIEIVKDLADEYNKRK
ncbi:MAG: pentapeptide repeat-containing protein [Flavobacteriia bacterium]|nr:pentapeptide repeat-containing protein [Flavobacteriia bacterium]